jgi:UDP-glucose:tetrahydrobiopterin glucosyltransferase
LGSGIGGGVELNVANLARQSLLAGDEVCILAPAGSVVTGVPCIEVAGEPPDFAQASGRQSPIVIPLPSVLANLWTAAHQLAPQFDLVVNWAYDWLPFYLTPFFSKPVAHIVSMGSLNDGLDTAIAAVCHQFPGTVAVHSRSQAATFANISSDAFAILPCGIDVDRYRFVPQASEPLCWIGRIAPEKGLEDCAALSERLGEPISVLGKLQDEDYWQRVQQQYPKAQLEYRGFLPTDGMQAVLGKARSLLMTPKWVEAFGMVAVEALACGVPAIAYDRGGPAEIVESGKTGWVVEPDSIDALAAAVAKLDAIDRFACRERAAKTYSLEAMRRSFENWTRSILDRYP